MGMVISARSWLRYTRYLDGDGMVSPLASRGISWLISCDRSTHKPSFGERVACFVTSPGIMVSSNVPELLMYKSGRRLKVINLDGRKNRRDENTVWGVSVLSSLGKPPKPSTLNPKCSNA